MIEMSKRNIIFTGGGSGGHVMPAVTLIKALKEQGEYDIFYVGGKGIEKEIISEMSIPYFSISTGKLRRYFSLKNLLDVYKVLVGTLQSLILLLKFNKKDTLVFSTGGFVSIPVVLAAKLLGKTIYVHEQTSRVGLANKIASKLASKVFISFEKSKNFFPIGKTYFSGYPLRDECFIPMVSTFSIRGVEIKDIKRPILFVTGGGNGSLLINNLIKENLTELVKKYYIVHQVGKNFIEEFMELENENYHPVSFIKNEMISYFKAAAVVISRAGAGTVSELLALRKRSIFIPLKIAQKNEQFHNAQEAKLKLDSLILTEDMLKGLDLIAYLNEFENISSRVFEDIKERRAKDKIISEINTYFRP